MPPQDPCPCCQGWGGWNKNTYKPATKQMAGTDWQRCLICEGTGERPEWLKRG